MKALESIEIIPVWAIEAFMKRESERMGECLVGYEISWYTVEDDYVLYIASVSNTNSIVKTGNVPAGYEFGEIKELGKIEMIADNALERIQATGRALYYRLWRKYQNVKRNLGKFKLLNFTEAHNERARANRNNTN